MNDLEYVLHYLGFKIRYQVNNTELILVHYNAVFWCIHWFNSNIRYTMLDRLLIVIEHRREYYKNGFIYYE